MGEMTIRVDDALILGLAQRPGEQLRGHEGRKVLVGVRRFAEALQRGHRPLLGTYVVARPVQRGGHPVTVHLEPRQHLARLAGGDDGAAQQRAQGVPLRVPGPGRSLVAETVPSALTMPTAIALTRGLSR